MKIHKKRLLILLAGCIAYFFAVWGLMEVTEGKDSQIWVAGIAPALGVLGGLIFSGMFPIITTR